MQENEQHGTKVLIVMAGLCLVAILLGVILLVSVREETDTTPISPIATSKTPVSQQETEITPRAFSSDELGAIKNDLFDLELTDIMAPLPMEGVEPAGSSSEFE